MPIVERIDQENLILYEILRNPVLCTEFIYNVDTLEGEEQFEYTEYQKEFMCDFNSYVSLSCARSVGKTYAIVGIIVWILIFNVFPLEYVVYGVPGKVHLEPVWSRLIRNFRSNSFLKFFLGHGTGINNSEYILKLLNNSQLMCRLAGQTGTGINFIGLHMPFYIIDESGYFPWSAFTESQPTLNTFTPGFRLITSGVPTGLRERNVNYHCDQENSNYSKHKISALQNPRFSEEDKLKAEELYGGTESDDYIHLVLGLHGKPVFALFDRNMMQISNYPVFKLTLDGTRFFDNIMEYTRALSIFPGLPDKDSDCLIGVDLGYCYSSDTEVLTKRGWVRHENIVQGDLIATYSTEKDEIIWDNYVYLWEQDYKGKMIHVTGKSVDFMVSPEHSVWVNRYKESKPTKYEKLKAKDLLNLKNNRFSVKISANSKRQIGPKTFNVPYYYCDRKDRDEKDTEVPMSTWVEFLAWFISEGSTTASKDWLVNITQQIGEYSKLIDENLSKFPYHITRKEYITQWGKTQVQWGINCKELCLWLRENCGVHSENKKIPEFIFDCSTEDQELFLKTILFGDGSRVNSSRSPQYNSQSEILVDQIQRLAISLGYSSTKGYYPGTGGMYRCTIMKRQDNQLYRDSSVKEIDYNDKIYCLKTNTGFYVTRRNGRIIIAGNTEPTAISILYTDRNGLIKFHGRITLSKVNYFVQEKIIDYLDTKFKPYIIGMDEGSAGKAVIPRLQEHEDFLHKDYKKRLIPINFSSSIILGTDSEGNEIKSKTKPFSVSVLQDYTNNHKIVYTSTDLEMITELERMTYSKTPTGEIVYKTLTERGGKKGEDHFTSALLCASLAYYMNNELLDFRAKQKKLIGAHWNFSVYP